MKYMLLIYADENAWTEAEREDCYAESVQLTQTLNAKGQYLGASPLQSIAMATSVRVRKGQRLITDGPFAETREQLGGYFLVEAEHLMRRSPLPPRFPVRGRERSKFARSLNSLICLEIMKHKYFGRD
jgi:hypothetical protein